MNNSPSLANKHTMRLAHHQELFKTKGPDSAPNSPSRSQNSNSMTPTDFNGNSPSWRNVYKKRCFDEFKKSRQKLMNKFRDLKINGVNQNQKLKDYLEEELNKICLLEAKSESLPLDAALEIYQQIQHELIPLEYTDNQLSEYYEYDQLNEMINNEAIYNQLHAVVVCPICQKANLKKENNLIKCTSCSFQITTQFELSDLSMRLEHAIKQHPCNDIPVFEYKNYVDKNDAVLMSQLGLSSNQSSFLIMSCDKCSFTQFII